MLLLVGSHANYYLLLGALLLPEARSVVTRVIGFLLLFTTFAYPIALIVSYVLALVRKWFTPFGILMVFNIILIVGVLILAGLYGDGEPILSALVTIDILGNTIYALAYFRLLRERSCQKDIPVFQEP